VTAGGAAGRGGTVTSDAGPTGIVAYALPRK
jgi:hypothetical protein